MGEFAARAKLILNQLKFSSSASVKFDCLNLLFRYLLEFTRLTCVKFGRFRFIFFARPAKFGLLLLAKFDHFGLKFSLDFLSSGLNFASNLAKIYPPNLLKFNPNFSSCFFSPPNLKFTRSYFKFASKFAVFAARVKSRSVRRKFPSSKLLDYRYKARLWRRFRICPREFHPARL